VAGDDCCNYQCSAINCTVYKAQLAESGARCITYDGTLSADVSDREAAASLCPEGTQYVVDKCGCGTCEKVYACPSCERPTCSDRETLTVNDGQCCPVCVPVPTCNYTCETVVCEDGFSAVKVDGLCCEVCVANDRCLADYNCPMPASTDCYYSYSAISREGYCCEQCAYCQETDRTACTITDKPVCRPGVTYDDGTGNCIDIPENTDRSSSIDIVITGDLAELDAHEIEIYISKVTGVPLEYIDVEVGTDRDGGKVITVTIRTDDQQDITDPQAAISSIEELPTSDPNNFSSANDDGGDTSEEENNAQRVCAAVLFTVFAILLVA